MLIRVNPIKAGGFLGGDELGRGFCLLEKMDPFCKKSLFLKAEKMALISFENNN